MTLQEDQKPFRRQWKAKPHKLHYDRTGKHYDSVFYCDGKDIINVPVTIDAALVNGSRKANPWECLLQRALMLYARRYPGAFPHPMIDAYVIRSAIWIIVRVHPGGRAPSHCVRYFFHFKMPDGSGMNADETFDQLTKTEFLKRFNGGGFTLVLRPAVRRGGAEGPGARNERRHPNDDPSRKPRLIVSRGAQRRAQLAFGRKKKFGERQYRRERQS
jgi:hypothetical protein